MDEFIADKLKVEYAHTPRIYMCTVYYESNMQNIVIFNYYINY